LTAASRVCCAALVKALPLVCCACVLFFASRRSLSDLSPRIACNQRRGRASVRVRGKEPKGPSLGREYTP
jgi:hypothetical protein